jgi:predicted nucleic acid-binding protein
MNRDERIVLLDASVVITLAEIDSLDLLAVVRGGLVVPEAVRREISNEPAKSSLDARVADGSVGSSNILGWAQEAGRRELFADSAVRLGNEPDAVTAVVSNVPMIVDGDVALLTGARLADECVVITDDKPLRRTCKSTSIPISGTIGVLVRAVETGDIDPDTAKEKLYAMDEVSARLSASLVKRAAQLIDDAAD